MNAELELTTDANEKKGLIEKFANEELISAYADLDDQYNAKRICSDKNRPQEYENFADCKAAKDAEKLAAKEDVYLAQKAILEEAGIKNSQVNVINFDFKLQNSQTFK